MIEAERSMITQDTSDVASLRETAAVIPLAASRLTGDAALLAAYRHGDVRAFEMLFDRHQGRLRAMSVRYLADAAEADDVVQETFLRLLRIAERVDEDFKVMAWLHRVAANLCITALRRRGRIQLVSGDEEWILATRDQHRARQPDQAYEMGQARDRLRRVAAGLPAQQRAAFLMREIDGLSYGDIAVRLGISHGAVESLLFRARRRFKQEYLRLEGEEPTTCATVRHQLEVIGRAHLGAWQEHQVARLLDECSGCHGRCRGDAAEARFAGAVTGPIPVRRCQPA
jgi:RNA polymerase sigma-70 factor (ECF subfamily)